MSRNNIDHATGSVFDKTSFGMSADDAIAFSSSPWIFLKPAQLCPYIAERRPRIVASSVVRKNVYIHLLLNRRQRRTIFKFGCMRELGKMLRAKEQHTM